MPTNSVLEALQLQLRNTCNIFIDNYKLKLSSLIINTMLIYYTRHYSMSKRVITNSTDFYLCFWVALLHSVSYHFFLYWSPSSSLCTVFDYISSNVDEVLSVNPSVNVFAFGDFSIHHEDWLDYSSWTDRSSELCHNLKQPYSDGLFSYSDPRL